MHGYTHDKDNYLRRLRRIEGQVRGLRKMIEEGITDGSIAPCNPKMVTFTLFGAFNWLAHWYKEDGELQPEAIADQLLSLFEVGLVPLINE